MTSIFDEKGNLMPVTVIEAGPMTVVQVKTPEKDKYSALQMGFGEKKLQRAKKPELGHARKAGTSPKQKLKEVRVPAEVIGNFSPGQVIKLSDLPFAPGDLVDVSGVSIGKGFAGVMKRHKFHGFDHTHGSHEYLRHPGSIGTNTTPGRTLKGKKMAGHMGSNKVTAMSLKVVAVKPEENLILLKGSVPGYRDGIVIIRAAKKKRKKAAGEAA